MSSSVSAKVHPSCRNGSFEKRLHAFGHLNAEQAHAEADDFCHCLGEGETEEFEGLVGLAKDGEIVVELVERLGEFVAVIADARRAVVGACLTNGCGELAELLDELGFFS